MGTTDGSDLDTRVVEAFTRRLLQKSGSEINIAYAAVKSRFDDHSVEDPELTRKLRLAVRRLHYNLEAMRSLDGSLPTEDLMQDLCAIGKPLGNLRDAQTLEAIVTRALGARDTHQGRQLLERATRSRQLQQRAIDEVINTDGVAHLSTLIDTLRETLTVTEFSQEDLRPVAHGALHESWRTLSRSAKKSRKRGRNDDVHRTRIKAKHMLYLAKETSPIFHTPSTEFVVRLDRLQHYLGEQHDHVIVATWLRHAADEDPSLRTLATELAARERQRAKKRRRRWIKRWNQVEEVQEHQTWR